MFAAINEPNLKIDPEEKEYDRTSLPAHWDKKTEVKYGNGMKEQHYTHNNITLTTTLHSQQHNTHDEIQHAKPIWTYVG